MTALTEEQATYMALTAPPITTGTRVMHRHSKQVGTVEGVEGDKALVKYERWVGGPYPVSIASLDVLEVEG